MPRLIFPDCLPPAGCEVCENLGGENSLTFWLEGFTEAVRELSEQPSRRKLQWARSEHGRPVPRPIRTAEERDAVVIQTRGIRPERPCARCKESKGPFGSCVRTTLETRVGIHIGSCANCLWNSQAGQCSLRLPEPCSFPELSLTDGIASQLERFEAICAAYFGTEPSSSTEATQLQTMDTPSSGTELSLSTEATQPETIYTSSSGTESPSSPEAKKLEITDAPNSGTESSSSIEATQLETTDTPISGAESASSTEDTQLETIDTPSSGTELALSTEMLKAPEPLQTTNAASASGSSGIRATAAALRHPLQFLLDHIPSIQTNDPETVYKEIVTQLNRSCLECEASLRLQGRLWRTGKM